MLCVHLRPLCSHQCKLLPNLCTAPMRGSSSHPLATSFFQHTDFALHPLVPYNPLPSSVRARALLPTFHAAFCVFRIQLLNACSPLPTDACTHPTPHMGGWDGMHHGGWGLLFFFPTHAHLRTRATAPWPRCTACHVAACMRRVESVH
jgi:hypothetical protein